MEITQVTRDNFYKVEKPNESSKLKKCEKRKSGMLKKAENFLKYLSSIFL